MTLRQQTTIEISAPDEPQNSSLGDLTMAWAIDRDTRQARYILQLDEAHRGAACNCVCPSCNLPLTAVNAAKTTWQRRPHFRHPEGAARERCVIVAARRALEEMFEKQQRLVLPRRRRSQNVEGLSGKYFEAWVERPAEAVRISDCTFRDEAQAFLTLDDGRRLAVNLVGRGKVSRQNESDSLLAMIEIDVEDPSFAMMTPEEIFSRLELAWSSACWVRHWEDGTLDADAEAAARGQAADALDWLDADDLPSGLTPAERRETLLHREVKAILERERRIRVPELPIEASWQRSNGFIDTRTWCHPEAEIALASVELEVHLGHSVPDVVATWVDDDGSTHSMLIEVTVTNPITDERIERLSSFGWPALEIDIGRMGGCVTRDELTRLVVDEVAGKRWLYHPVASIEESRLVAAMKIEEAKAVEAERKRQAIIDVPASQWASRYLEAFRRRWDEQLAFGDGLPDSAAWRQAQSEISEAVHALGEHGYPASSMDQHPLRPVIARILSIREGKGIEYKFDGAWGVINAILCDRKLAMQWHTLYLIALKTYPVALKGDQREKVDAWRNRVVGSLMVEEPTFVRETTYDRLIGLLFPEMHRALQQPFGTPLYIPFDIEPSPALRAQTSATNSDDALLHASGHAVSKGLSPAGFAKVYARQSGGLSADQIVLRLVQIGVAKNRWDWA